MRARVSALGLALVAAITAPAAADEVSGTRSELLTEVRHEVGATLHRGWVELSVRRTVHNGGERHDQAVFMIDVPEGAVATNLATLGSLNGRPHWFAGELMEAEAAAAKYRELTGIGGYYPKDPALLSWRHQRKLALQVFPCPPAADKSIAYTLIAPTRYQRGAHRFELPGLGTSDLTASVTVRSHRRSDRLLVDGKLVSGARQISPSLAASVELALRPAMRDPLAGGLAVVPFASNRVLTHLSFEARPELSQPPKRAYVVVALDVSRSIPESLLDAQKAAAAAYLSHLPDAQVEVLSYAREVERSYKRFVAAPRVVRELPTRSLERANGSAVDAALVEAEKLLARAPAGHPRRILLFSDGLTRTRLKVERLKSALGRSSAIAHLVIADESHASTKRNDDHAWAPAARATGGLVWSAGLGSESSNALRGVALEWVRPLRVDRFRIYSPDFALGDGEAPPEVLEEGEGFERTFIGPRPVSWVRAEGELWSRRIQHSIHPDPAHAKRWAALVFGSELLHSLSEPEMMTLALAGRAVSPVTSYLAIEPGVRPSTEGLEASEVGFGSGAGAISLRYGRAAVSGRALPIDREAFLKTALAAAWRACGGTPDTASVTFESTRDEVVDVLATNVGSATDPLLRPCLERAVWDLELVPAFHEEWNTWTIDV